jgi:hypothetical protein
MVRSFRLVWGNILLVGCVGLILRFHYNLLLVLSSLLGDLWNLKYLSKFKWSHLTEKVAYERRVREQKLRVEMMQARRENAAYVQMVETGKKLDKIEERKRKRGQESTTKATDEAEDGNKKRRKHKQMKPLQEGSDKSAKRALLGGLI